MEDSFSILVVEDEPPQLELIGGFLKKQGFEVVSGGTILLDEIGDLPAHLQAKLLRVLQEREFERVGSSRSIPVVVRILAATHRDLEGLLQSGQFRDDLY